MSTVCALIVDNRDVSDAIRRHKKFLPSNWLVIHLSPEIHNLHDYNYFMTRRELWMSLPEKVLVFQHDSGLLRQGVEEFLEWDYVGAPWAWQEWGGNGGLSLRSSSAMLKVIDSFAYDGLNEDHFFCKGLRELGLKLAPREVCEKFSVECCYKLGTVGYHAIQNHLSELECNNIITQYDNFG